MNNKAVLGIAVGLGIAIIGGYVGYTHIQAQAAERADRLMRAELRCDGMKEDVLELTKFAFGVGITLGSEYDTPENWKKEMEGFRPHMIKVGHELYGSSQAVQDVAHAMIPYSRDLWAASDREEAQWRVGREVCLQLEMKR